MSKCALTKAEREALLGGVPEEGRRRVMDEHLDKCPECRSEAAAVERLLKETEAVRSEIREAVSSVDWEALPALIAERALAASTAPARAASSPAPRDRFAFLLMRPVLAGLLAGLVVGAAAMYFVLRAPGSRPEPDLGFHASGEFLDRAELEMARRNTLDYLEKSQYLLLDVFESAAAGRTAPAVLGSEQTRDLLARKKYLNGPLERFQMAKAKAICDQIEMLFRELSGISEEMSAAELERIRDFVEERQILLKINLVRKELEREI